MGRKYDIAQRIANSNQKPVITIDEEHEYKINNGKSAALMFQALADKMSGDSGEDSLKAMDEMITLALGKEAAEYITTLDMSLPAYQLIIKVIMAAFSDSDLEEVEEETEKAKRNPEKK